MSGSGFALRAFTIAYVPQNLTIYIFIFFFEIVRLILKLPLASGKAFILNGQL